MLGVIIHSHCVRVGARVRTDIFVVISTVTDTYDENTQLNPVKPVPGQNLGPIIRSCPQAQKKVHIGTYRRDHKKAATITRGEPLSGGRPNYHDDGRRSLKT